MYPVYQVVDSYPHQMSQMLSTPRHHHPKFEAFPGQMEADFERCPPYYQSWPSAGNYCHPYPAQWHSCCDHNYFPGYCAPRPSYAHAPPPYYHGSYPVPRGAYPVHYIPPPNCTMEPQRYMYHSDMPGYSHCCGCPNQTCNATPVKNVKIEEEDPDSENKTNDFLVPFDLKNHPYPVVWIPPGYMMNKANNKAHESQPEAKEKYCGAAMAHERSKPLEQQQNFLNRWFPFDMENSRSARQGGDSTRKQQHQDEDMHKLSFPSFWMPWSLDEIKKRKDSAKINFGEESAQGTPSQLEVTPLTLPDTEEKTCTPNVIGEINNREYLQTVEKNSAQKTVPVKAAEPTEENKTPENVEERVKSSSAKNVNNSDERISGRSKSSSLPKSLKLPPICLRVDPLRKKKNTSGSSRSPCPPGDKGKLRDLSKDSAQPPISSTAKEIAEQDMTVRESVPERTKDVEQSKIKLKRIEVTDGSGRQEETENLNITDPDGSSLPVNSRDAGLLCQTDDKSEEAFPDAAASEVNLKSSDEGKNDQGTVQRKSIDSRCQMDEDKENSKADETAGKTNEFAKIRLSESEAALIIQSAYRGYEVRRWEPLKKLKQIANISEEFVKLSNRIQAVELRYDTQDNDKWTTMLGETIMNLLLKLDAIQGLHPSIRDARKSVVRKLVSLQEKLDHLSLKKPGSTHELGSGAKSYEDIQTIDNPCFQGGEEEEEEEKAFLANTPSKAENVHEVYSDELSQVVAPIVMNNASNFSSLEIPDMVRSKEDMGDGSREPATDLLGVNTRDMSDASKEAATDLLGVNTTETSEPRLLPETGARDDSMNLACNGGQEMIYPMVEGADSPVMDEVSNLMQLEELPEGVLDLDTKLQDNDLLLFEARDDKVLMGELVMENDVHVEELTQLPQCVPDDESEKHVILEQKDDKVVKDEVTIMDSNAEVRDCEILNMDQADQWQESMVMVPVISESNESLACHVNVDNNKELCKKANFGSHAIPVQALEEKSFVSKLGDVSVIHDKVVSEIDNEVLDSYKDELDSCFGQTEKELLTTPTEPVEVCQAEEQVLQELAFMENETENLSQNENVISDLKNSSSCKDAIAVAQECDAPSGLTKSRNVENEQKLLEETIEMEASGVAIGDYKLFAQPCYSATLEQDIVDQMETVPLDATETEGELQPASPIASQISLESNASTEQERKLIEENEKLREMMQKLIEVGKEQLSAFSNLSGRIKDLEKKLSRKNKLKMRRRGTTQYTYGMSCLKPSNDPLNGKPVPLAA